MICLLFSLFYVITNAQGVPPRRDGNSTSGTRLTGDTLKPLLGNNILFIIAHQDFRDEEYLVPHDILEHLGANITVASSDTTLASGMIQIKVKPDILIENADPLDFDAIVFIGGSGAQEYFNSEIALKIADTASKNKKIIGAICIAPVILAKAGVLRLKSATVWRSEETMAVFKANKVKYTGRPVEVSGKIVTADGPKSAKPFAEELVRLLLKENLSRPPSRQGGTSKTGSGK